MNPFAFGGQGLRIAAEPEKPWSKRTTKEKLAYLYSRVSGNIKSMAWMWIPYVAIVGVTSGLHGGHEDMMAEQSGMTPLTTAEKIMARCIQLLPLPY